MTQAAKPGERARVLVDEDASTVALIVNAGAPTFASAKGNPILFTTKGRFVPFGPSHEIQVTVRPIKARAASEAIGLSYED